MKTYAFSFQMVALQDRFEIHRQAFEFASKGGIALIDRGIYGDMAFAHADSYVSDYIYLKDSN